MAKITDEQLKKVVEQQDELSSILHKIGVVESQKHSLLHQIAEVNKEVEEYKLKLEEEYGSISIDLKTGEYTIIEKEEE
jgi:predicted  nucleic acid-binding Zn-ribbon protein